jgi:hypothetical protein
MTQPFAVGRKAKGCCDRCAQIWPLTKLRPEAVGGRLLGNRVCPDCWDDDHPQNWQGRYPVTDPQALRNPRPDPSDAASRNLFGGPNSLIVTDANKPVSTEGDSPIVTE